MHFYFCKNIPHEAIQQTCDQILLKFQKSHRPLLSHKKNEKLLCPDEIN